MKVNKSFVVNVEARSVLIAEAFGVESGWKKEVISDLELPDVFPSIVLVTGESGCGKSTLMREVFGIATSVEIPNKPLYLWASTPEDGLRLLNSVGLNDASLFLLKFEQLSDSQQARARMYAALCQGVKQLVVDEFLATLDRKTAKVLAYTFQKILRREGVKLVAVTAQEDLEKFLQPDLVIEGRAFPSRWGVKERKDLIINPYIFEVEQCTSQSKHKANVQIDGTVSSVSLGKDEYREHRLGEIHYRGKYTGGAQEYFKALSPEGEIVGWLVGQLVPGSRKLEKGVTGIFRIARLVVHPTYRNCGIGQALVKRYLELHPDADTIAAMARFNPVFEKAGMQRVDDVEIKTPKSIKESFPDLSEEEWAFKSNCNLRMMKPENRVLLSKHVSFLMTYWNPGGKRTNGGDFSDIKDKLEAELKYAIKNDSELAGRLLWCVRPRRMAKFVGPQNKLGGLNGRKHS